MPDAAAPSSGAQLAQHASERVHVSCDPVREQGSHKAIPEMRRGVRRVRDSFARGGMRGMSPASALQETRGGPGDPSADRDRSLVPPALVAPALVASALVFTKVAKVSRVVHEGHECCAPLAMLSCFKSIVHKRGTYACTKGTNAESHLNRGADCQVDGIRGDRLRSANRSSPGGGCGCVGRSSAWGDGVGKRCTVFILVRPCAQARTRTTASSH